MSGSTFHNYKGSHSIVLLALCDAQYRFTLVDIGGEGRHSDGGIFKNSTIGQRINSNDMNFPAPRTLGSGNVPLNYFIAADGAFPLSVSTMRPYPGSFLPQQKHVFLTIGTYIYLYYLYIYFLNNVILFLDYVGHVG